MHFSTSIEIRLGDIDKFGHVNNAKYLTYIEHARVKYFDKIIGCSVDWTKEGIILARTEIDFILPIYLEDKIEIETFVSRLGNKSFDMTYTIFKIENETKIILAKSLAVLVCFNYPENKTIPIPTEWIEKIEKFERII